MGQDRLSWPIILGKVKGWCMQDGVKGSTRKTVFMRFGLNMPLAADLIFHVPYCGANIERFHFLEMNC